MYANRTIGAGNLDGRGFVTGPYVSARHAAERHHRCRHFLRRLDPGRDRRPSSATLFSGSYTTQRVIANARLDGLFMLDALVIRPDATLYLSYETGGDYTVQRCCRATSSTSPASPQRASIFRAAQLIERPIAARERLDPDPASAAHRRRRPRVHGSLTDPYGTRLGRASSSRATRGSSRSAVEGSLWASSLKAAPLQGRHLGRVLAATRPRAAASPCR